MAAGLSETSEVIVSLKELIGDFATEIHAPSLTWAIVNGYLPFLSNCLL